MHLFTLFTHLFFAFKKILFMFIYLLFRQIWGFHIPMVPAAEQMEPW